MQRLHRFPESLLRVLKQKSSKVLPVSEGKDVPSSQPSFSWVCPLRPLLVSCVAKKAALASCSLHSQLWSKSGRWGALSRAGLPVVATVAKPVWICVIPSQHTEHRITESDRQQNAFLSKCWTHKTFHYWPNQEFLALEIVIMLE